MKKGIYLSAKEILKLKTDLPPIKKLLDEIQNPSIRAFTKQGLENAPDKFWINSCSIRMSKNIPFRAFHNPITLTNPGGIINHKIVAVYVGLDALRRRPRFRIDIKEVPFQIPKPKWKDRTISAVLLHDICKNGVPWSDRVHPQHGELAVKILKQLSCSKKLNPYDRQYILNGIKWHMGTFFHPDREFKFTEFERVIQEADYYSTRRFLTGVDIDVELINYPPKTHD